MRFSFTKLLATSFSLALASSCAITLSAYAQGETQADQAAFSDDGSTAPTGDEISYDKRIKQAQNGHR